MEAVNVRHVPSMGWSIFGHTSFILLLMIYVKVHQRFLGQASLIMQTFTLE